MIETAIVLPPGEGFGPGAAGAIGLLVRRLACAGASGVVLGVGGSTPPFADVAFEPIQLGWGLSRRRRYLRGLRAALDRLQPRLIEVHNRPELALWLAGSFTPVSLILNNDPQTMRCGRTGAARSRLLKRLDLVLTSSHYLRSRLLEGVPCPAHDPVVLPNCTDIPPPSAAPRENLILFAGRIVPDKGPDSFVEACALALPQLPGWRAEMIGADRFSPFHPPTEFERLVAARADAVGVLRHGYLAHEAVLEAMQRAAIVVVPSRWQEPFGIVALEAIASGAALICSPHGGLPEIADETALYIDPDHPPSIASAMVELARDIGQRASRGAAGRLRAEGFRSELAAAKLNRWREQILARRAVTQA